MSELEPGRLHIRFMMERLGQDVVLPRRYTLTHSDVTGQLFLSIGPEYDDQQIGGLYTRLMRDEVLAEWKKEGSAHVLHVYCHVSGGLVVGSAAWRNGILLKHMGLVIEALSFADQAWIAKHGLAGASVLVHFRSSQPQYNRVESWGLIEDHLRKHQTNQT